MSSQFRSSAHDLERTIPTWTNAGTGRGRDTRREWESLRSRGLLPQRILIDATYTLGSSRRSGIERVVRNLMNHGLALAGASNVPSAALMSMHGQFFEMGEREQARLTHILKSQSDILGSMPTIYRRCVEPLVRSYASTSKLKNWLLPEPGHMGLFKLPYRYWYRASMRNICKRSKSIEPGRGDLLVLPDAYWARKEIWPAVAAARSRGAYTAVVVYDLIPLTHSHFVGERRTRRFAEYLKEVATHADMIVAISATVRQQLEATLPELMAGQPYCQNICDFPLGAEFRQAATETIVRDDLLDLFDGERDENPYLTVAAFDPRKNHRYLLDAFDLLWQRITDPAKRPKLCLVGRVGGHCGEIIQRVKHHPLRGSHLFAFHDLNDAELAYCYQQCRGVIFPSIVEGFGLPIVEAMWHRAPVMASDTSIHREVGGDSCQYFDLASPASLAHMLQARQDPANETQMPSMALPYSWQQSAEIFYHQCLEGYASTYRQPQRRAG